MRRRSPSSGITLCSAGGALALLALFACSSSDTPSRRGEDGDAGADGGGADGALAEDAGSDALPDAGPPPPYDFAVACAATPCITQIAARGGAHVCALLQDGSVRCWGSNASGQLGTGGDASSMPSFEASPRAVAGAPGAKSVVATGKGTSGTTCVVSIPGTVTCFGSDASGQLGRDGGGDEPRPNPVPAPVDGLQAKSVTLANTFALAIGVDDRLWSWGANDTSQLGRAEEAPVGGAARAERIAGAVRSSAGTSTTGFVVTDDGALLSWGGATSEQLGRTTSLARDPLPAPIALTDVSSVAAGAAHACALRRGRVHCWGANEDGQLGTGRKAAEWYPADVALPDDVYAVAVAAGGDDTCIIAAAGDVYCWGANGSGQIGAPPGSDQAMPARVVGLGEQAVGVAMMDDTVCALLRSGSVVCWGDNRVGQLGRGSRDAELHPAPGPVVFP